MKAKKRIQSNLEVLNAKQLSEIKGGKKVIIIVNGKPVEVEIPD